MSFFNHFLISQKNHAIPVLHRNLQTKCNLISAISGNKIDMALFEKKYRNHQSADVNFFKSIKLAIHLLLFTVIFFAQNANAICVRNPAFPVTNFNMDGGTIIVKAEAKVPDVIATIERNITPPTGPTDRIMNCSGGGAAHYSVGVGTAVPGFDKVYTTNIPGIGYRLSYNFGRSGLPDPKGKPIPFETQYGPSAPGVQLGNPQTFTLEFLIISDIPQGGILFSGDVMRFTDDRGEIVMRAFLNGNATRIIMPSCRVAGPPNKPIDVLFGKVPQSNFKGRGSVAAERNFSITLSCRAGIGVQSMVYLRMDATKDPAAVGDDGVLQITQGGVNNATGVGIQIVDGNSRAPVKFGSEAQVGSSKDGDYVLPYTARYFQTGNRVTPGQANGTATFTVIYK